MLSVEVQVEKMLGQFRIHAVQVHQVSWVAEHARLSLSLKRGIANEAGFRSGNGIVALAGHGINVFSVLGAGRGVHDTGETVDCRNVAVFMEDTSDSGFAG